MKLHFVGIGGAGMAPLAGIALEQGHAVSGSDREANVKTALLAERGAAVAIGHDRANLPAGVELVIHSSAVAADNPELAAARERGVPVMRRGEYLAESSNRNRRLIAVSGSHGKTSVTAMIAWILAAARPDAGWLIGGEVAGDFPASRAGSGDLFVTEVDESDGTHTLSRPWLGVVPNIDDDHSWSVGGDAQLLENFATFGRGSHQVLYVDGGAARRLYENLPQAESADLASVAVPPNLVGFQRDNGILAALAARRAGVADAEIWRALETFPGVLRRLTPRGCCGDLILMEDYAHHPEELRRSLATLRELHPGRRLAVLFQPHRYARLEKYFDRMVEELRTADEVYLVPVFAAWCDRGRVDSADWARAVGDRAVYLEGEWSEIAGALLARTGAEVLAVIGAGDLDRLFAHLVPSLQK